MINFNNRVQLFEQVFYETKDQLYGFAKKLLRHDENVQDCMQQCYLKLWETMDTIDLGRDVRPLLYTYARNLVIDGIRKNRRYVWLGDQASLASHFSEQEQPDSFLALHETGEEIDTLLQQLPPRRRQVFSLIRIEGYSYREVADMLGLSVSTVEKHMHEAYKFLLQENTLKLLLLGLVLRNLAV